MQNQKTMHRKNSGRKIEMDQTITSTVSFYGGTEAKLFSALLRKIDRQ